MCACQQCCVWRVLAGTTWIVKKGREGEPSNKRVNSGPILMRPLSIEGSPFLVTRPYWRAAEGSRDLDSRSPHIKSNHFDQDPQQNGRVRVEDVAPDAEFVDDGSRLPDMTCRSPSRSLSKMSLPMGNPSTEAPVAPEFCSDLSTSEKTRSKPSERGSRSKFGRA